MAHLALVGSHAPVGEQVCVQVAQLLKQLPAEVASMWLNAVVPQDVCDQVVFGGVGLFTHATLPSLLVTSNIDIIAFINVDIETQLFSTGRPTSRSSIAAPVTLSELLSGVESAGGEVHDWPGHEKWEWQQAVVERGEVWRVEEERRRRPYGGRTERLLFHLHRCIHAWVWVTPGQRPVMKLQPVKVDHTGEGLWRWRGNESRWEAEGDIGEVHRLLTAAVFCLLCRSVRRFTLIGFHLERSSFAFLGSLPLDIMCTPGAQHGEESRQAKCAVGVCGGGYVGVSGRGEMCGLNIEGRGM